MPVVTVAHKILENGNNMPDRPAYFVKSNGTWQPTSWRGYADQVMQASKSLIALGVEPGNTVNILGFNRPEWVVFNVAAMAVGAVPAGIYTTNSPTEVQYIVGHSEAPVVLVENEDQWAKVNQVRNELPHLRKVVLMKGSNVDDELAISWDDFIAAGAAVDDEAVEARLDALQLEDLATLIYTSGTTGPPKGVMLSHDNMAWTPPQIMPALAITSDDRVLSYLPLSHIAEQSFTISGAADVGYSVYYAESIEKLADNLKEVKPTVFFAVPRVWERFYDGVTAALKEQTGLKATLVSWARGVASKANALHIQGKKPSGLLGAQYAVASKLLGRVKAELGLDELKVGASGAAPVSKEILEYMASLDIVVYEVYGQSEGTGPTSFNVPGRAKFGSVGPAYPGTQVKIADDGEILLKGRNVFLGYYKDPQASSETLVDGWLHSGDLGEFDDDGMLWITGRKKEILITAGGKNVAPKDIETGIKVHPLVSEVVVIGDRRKFLSALVTLNDEAATKYMADNDLEGDPTASDAVKKEIQVAVDGVNEHLARVEQIKKFTVLERQLTIEDGELTPTLKVKRNKVNEHFADEIEAMYAD